MGRDIAGANVAFELGENRISTSLCQQNGEENDVEKSHHRNRQFQNERARLIELVHHEIVKLAHGAELLVHEVAIFGDAKPRGCQAINTGIVDIAYKFDRIVDALGEFHHVQAKGVETLSVAR